MNIDYLIISQIVNNEAMVHKYQNSTISEIKIMLMEDYSLKDKDAESMAKKLIKYIGGNDDE